MTDSVLSQLLDQFIDHQGTDLYITVDSKALMRNEEDNLVELSDTVLDGSMVDVIIKGLLSEEAIDEFESTLEYNTAIFWQDRARFRVNVFKQRQHSGLVLRRVSMEIPSIEELKLPQAYADMAMQKRGLVLIVGPTGSGKSTSMAAMINQRNENASGHIVTVEDPIEFVHAHKKCIVTQRDVGIDTYSYGIALKNVLRQRPDVIVIGEIRDRDTMEHALKFSETGHLCIATLHAGNAGQALERIMSFFSEDKQQQVCLSMSINLKGVLCQRLIANKQGARSMANEIMLNQGLIRNLLYDGKIKEIPPIIEKSKSTGMMSFDHSIMDLVRSGNIDEALAIAEADNPANLKLHITKRDMDQRLGDGSSSPSPAVTSKPEGSQF